MPWARTPSTSTPPAPAACAAALPAHPASIAAASSPDPKMFPDPHRASLSIGRNRPVLHPTDGRNRYWLARCEAAGGLTGYRPHRNTGAEGSGVRCGRYRTSPDSATYVASEDTMSG